MGKKSISDVLARVNEILNEPVDEAELFEAMAEVHAKLTNIRRCGMKLEEQLDEILKTYDSEMAASTGSDSPTTDQARDTKKAKQAILNLIEKEKREAIKEFERKKWSAEISNIINDQEPV